MADSPGGRRRRNPAIVAAVIGVAGAIAAALIANPPDPPPDPVPKFQREIAQFCERAPNLPPVRDFAPLDVDSVPLDGPGYANALAQVQTTFREELRTLPATPPDELEKEVKAERAARKRFMTALGRHIRYLNRAPQAELTEPPSGRFAQRDAALDRDAARWGRSLDRLSGGRCIGP
jgi:hypothetical protein